MTLDRRLEEPRDLFIDQVRDRPLNGGDLEVRDMVERGDGYAVHRINYSSDDLRISGIVALPDSPGPHPVVIINHGFFPPENYHSGKGTWNELNALAGRGYLTVAPDYRNYGDSDSGDSTFVPGFLHDVRNLVPALAEHDQADGTRIAMMGHSMGAGITLQCLATGSDVRAAVLLGAVTGHEAERYDARRTRWSQGNGAAARGLDEFTERFGTPDEAPESYARMSVIHHLDSVAVPVTMHHGAQDEICPLSWATEIRDRLHEAGKLVELHVYPEAGHVFRDEIFELMIDRTDRFFRTYLNLE